jgi:hypothetical protein
MAMLFIFSEAVLCVGFAITLLVLRRSIEQLDLATAMQEVPTQASSKPHSQPHFCKPVS